MICLKCENKSFEEKKVKIEQEFKGENFFVVVPAMVCSQCNFSQFTDEQADNLRRATADEYRKNHKLLTSTEIRKFRESMGMSQNDFSEYLGVGVASIKRWENYFVQEEAQDFLIRVKCDSTLAEANALEVSWIKDEPDAYNGYKKFDINIFGNLIAKFIEVAPSPLYFFKHIFYVDFLHYKQFHRSVTGMKYSCLPYGPIPKKYDALIEYIIKNEWFEKIGFHDLKMKKMGFDEKIFSTDELAIINEVYNIAQQKGCKYLLDKSHKEDPYTKCDFLGTLSYEFATSVSLE